MSGMRLFSYRQGDRSEYLAHYLMSGLGVITAVPRQEDIGIDLYCTLADQERGKLTFGVPFLVQVKSASDEPVAFGRLSSKGRWQREDITWLLRQEIPFFVGLVFGFFIGVTVSFIVDLIWFPEAGHSVWG